MNIVKLFSHSEIRFVTDPSQKYGFGIVTNDLASVLEIVNPRDMSTEEEWKGVANIDTPGGIQLMNVTWEPGVYDILAKSRKPNAKPFKKWLFEDVVPSIRETGSYGTPPIAKQVSEPEAIISLLDKALSGVPLKPELLAGVKLNIIKVAAPKEYYPAIEEARQFLIVNTAQENRLITPTEIGKILGISGQAVNKLLIERGLQVAHLARKSKKEPAYLPTEKGKEYSDLTLATGSSSSSTFQQLRWYESVIDLLK